MLKYKNHIIIHYKCKRLLLMKAKELTRGIFLFEDIRLKQTDI